jgi:hypothetical protein
MNALRYVVLHHEGIAEPHYDLMFETSPGSELTTWRGTEWPIHHASALTKLADHRRAYLDYEGPLSDDRGFVKRISAGTFLLANNNTGLFAGEFTDTGVQFTFVKDGRDSWVCYFAK